MSPHAPAPFLHCLFCPKSYPAPAAKKMDIHLLSAAAASDGLHHAAIIAARFAPATPSMLAIQSCPRAPGGHTRAQITALVLYSFGRAAVVVAQEPAAVWRARKQIPGAWWEGRVCEAAGLVAASLDRPPLGVEVICVGGFVAETLRLARGMWGGTRTGCRPSMRSLPGLPEREYGLDRYEDDEEPKHTPAEDHPAKVMAVRAEVKPPALANSNNKKRKISAAKVEASCVVKKEEEEKKTVGSRPPLQLVAGERKYAKGGIKGFCNGPREVKLKRER